MTLSGLRVLPPPRVAERHHENAVEPPHRAAPPARVERPAPRVERAVRGGGGGYGGEAQREGQAAAVDFCPWGAEILIGNDILRTAGGELPGIRAL
jgi:hypothetical protein